MNEFEKMMMSFGSRFIYIVNAEYTNNKLNESYESGEEILGYYTDRGKAIKGATNFLNDARKTAWERHMNAVFKINEEQKTLLQAHDLQCDEEIDFAVLSIGMFVVELKIVLIDLEKQCLGFYVLPDFLIDRTEDYERSEH